MTIKPKILVTSAGGKTGLPTVLQLRARDYPVRALLRRDDDRARLLREAGAEIFVGDQFALADMRRAMTGVQRAVLCAPTAPNGLHFGTVFALAAHEARLEHAVLLGQWLAQPDHPSMFTRETFFTEALMRMLPETTLTVNNVGWFADNYFMVLEPVAQLGLFPFPLGAGSVAKNAPPSNEDIAAVTVEALVDPARHAGKTYRPTGPALIAPDEMAATFSRVLNRKVVYRDISEAMMSKALNAQGWPAALQTQLRLYTREYRRGAFAVNAPSGAVADVTGREPEDFETIARRYVATRPEAVQGFGNRLRAWRFMARMLLTRSTDFDAVEKARDHVRLAEAEYCRDSETWRRSHDPSAGFVPDRAGAPVLAVSA